MNDGFKINVAVQSDKKPFQMCKPVSGFRNRRRTQKNRGALLKGFGVAASMAVIEIVNGDGFARRSIRHVGQDVLIYNQRFEEKGGMNIRPLHDRVVIKRLEEEQKTAGGIVIPDTAAEKPQRGEVIAVGNGKPLDNGETRKPEVKVGDKVMFGKFSGTEVKIDGDEVVVMREDDILAVVA